MSVASFRGTLEVTKLLIFQGIERGTAMDDVTRPTDPQTMKAFIRELARKNRVAQKNKDELSRAICGKFTALPSYTSAKTVMWYVDAGSEVRTRHTLPEALQHGKRVVVP